MSDSMVWGPNEEFAAMSEMRPFFFKEFILMPMHNNDSVCFHRDECDGINIGQTYMVTTDYEDSDSEFSILHRNDDGLFAVAYLNSVGYIPVKFKDCKIAEKFLRHLSRCKKL